MKLTAVIPCYNEEAALHFFYEKMREVMQEMHTYKSYCGRYKFRTDGPLFIGIPGWASGDSPLL